MSESIKKKLSPILDFISIKYIAEHYFKKTPQWFYQRLNENIVNGKPAQFTDKEINILNHALQDLSKKLGSVRVS